MIAPEAAGRSVETKRDSARRSTRPTCTAAGKKHSEWRIASDHGEAVLEASIEVMSEHGCPETALRDTAERVGTATAALRYRLQPKHEALEMISERGVEEQRAFDDVVGVHVRHALFRGARRAGVLARGEGAVLGNGGLLRTGWAAQPAPSGPPLPGLRPRSGVLPAGLSTGRWCR